MMRRRKDEYLMKHMNFRNLGGPIDVKDAVKTIVPFEVNRCAAAVIKGILQNGSKETIKCVVDDKIAKIDNESVHSNTYAYPDLSEYSARCTALFKNTLSKHQENQHYPMYKQ